MLGWAAFTRMVNSEAGKRRQGGAQSVDGDVDPGGGNAAQRCSLRAKAERLELPAEDGPADQHVENAATPKATKTAEGSPNIGVRPMARKPLGSLSMFDP